MKVWYNNEEKAEQSHRPYFYYLLELNRDTFELSDHDYGSITTSTHCDWNFCCFFTDVRFKYVNDFEEGVLFIQNDAGIGSEFSWMLENGALYLCPIGKLNTLYQYGRIEISISKDQKRQVFKVYAADGIRTFSNLSDAFIFLAGKVSLQTNSQEETPPAKDYVLALHIEDEDEFAFITMHGAGDYTHALRFTSKRQANIYKEYHAEFDTNQHRAWACSIAFPINSKRIR